VGSVGKHACLGGESETLRRVAARSERKAAACYQEVAEMRANPCLGHQRNIAIAPSFPAARYRQRKTQAQGFAVPTAASLILSLKCSSSDGTQSSSKIAAFARTNVTVSPTHGAVYTFGSVMVMSTVSVSASG